MAYKKELIDLAKETFNHFNYLKSNHRVVKSSIPILFFGNIEKYFNSNLKVVTVALNPSDQEFLKKDKNTPLEKPRFNFLDQISKNQDPKLYLKSLSGYFNKDNNPYNNWFDRNLEKIMNGLDLSFYSNRTKNRAIHTDICTPIATSPTWGGLTKDEKEMFVHDGYKIWLKLIKILKPQKILISVGEKYLKEFKFIDPEILPGNKPQSFTKDDVYNKDANLNSKNIKVFKHKEIPNIKIYKGQNNSGNPFGNIAYKEGYKEIEHVSALIMSN